MMAIRRTAAAVLVAVVTATVAIDPDVVDMVRAMTLEEKVGQMTQIDVSKVTTDAKLDKAKLQHWLRTYKIGSLLNSVYSGGACGDNSVPAGWTATEWRTFMHDLQQAAADEGVPPILYGLDSVHGATYVYGSTLFGHQIALAATFDRNMSRESGRVTARDTIAAGVPWLFAPILGLATQPSWSRVYETFGEDPYLASEMGVANIEGIQSDTEDPDLPKAAACMKHFFAYSHPQTGHDRAPVHLPERVLREYYMLPFMAAVKRAKVLTAMESYNELNGVPIAASKKYLRTLLRDELGFEGMLVTDWAEIINLHEFHRVAPNRTAAVHLAMNNTSIDMSMVPLDDSFPLALIQLVKENKVPMWRLDESVERVMQLKKDIGLLAHPVPKPTSPLISRVGKDGALALDIARASIALVANEQDLGYAGPKYCSPVLENTTVSNGHDIKSFHKEDTHTAEQCRDKCRAESNCERWLFMSDWLSSDWPVCFLKTEEAELETGPGHSSLGGYCETGKRTLPLDPTKLNHVLITGPTADSRVYQTGGWSIHWQGACDDDEFQSQGETIKTALKRLLPGRTRVTHTHGCNFNVPSHAQATCDISEDDMEKTLRAARSADVAIVALGEESYTEKPGDIDDLALHEGQLKLIRRLVQAKPELPIVLVLLEGRPRLLEGITELRQVRAVLHGLLPGPAGGTAIAEILLGITNPSGRLPYTYPAFPHAFDKHYSSVSSRCAGSAGAYLSTGTENCPVEYEFGHGMSYTSFAYSNMRTVPAASEVTHPATIEVLIDVNNTGTREGRHSALLFASQQYRRDGTAPEKQRLVGFEAVTLAPAQLKTVRFSVHTEQLAHVTEDMRRVVDASEYRLFFARQRHAPSLKVDVKTVAPQPETGVLSGLGNRALGVVANQTGANPTNVVGMVLIMISLTITCFCAGVVVAVIVIRTKAVGPSGYSRTSSVANMSTLNFLSSNAQPSHANAEISSQPSEASGLDHMAGSSYQRGLDGLGASYADKHGRLSGPLEEGRSEDGGEEAFYDGEPHGENDEDLEMVDLRVRGYK